MNNLFGDLENQFQFVQKSLNNIDENIKKITGNYPSSTRDLDDYRGGNRFNRGQNSNSERRFSGLKRKTIYLYDDDDDDDYEDGHSKRSLPSQILSTSWETKHREQVLEEQKNDKKTMSRNKRMFGMILGTLEKFKTEELQRKDTKKRAEIENKLDQVAEIEREKLKKEKELLFQERKIKTMQMKCLEQKIERATIHKEWEQSQQSVGNFIETKTKPYIFYMPVKHNKETLKRSKETKDKYRIILAEKRAKVQKELNEIDELFKQNIKELFGDDEQINQIINNLETYKNGHHKEEENINDNNNNNNNNVNNKKDSNNNNMLVEKNINNKKDNVENMNNNNVSKESSTKKIEKKHHHHQHHQHGKNDDDNVVDKSKIVLKDKRSTTSSSNKHHHSHHHHHHHEKKSIQNEDANEINNKNNEKNDQQKQKSNQKSLNDENPIEKTATTTADNKQSIDKDSAGGEDKDFEPIYD